MVYPGRSWVWVLAVVSWVHLGPSVRGHGIHRRLSEADSNFLGYQGSLRVLALVYKSYHQKGVHGAWLCDYPK